MHVAAETALCAQNLQATSLFFFVAWVTSPIVWIQILLEKVLNLTPNTPSKDTWTYSE